MSKRDKTFVLVIGSYKTLYQTITGAKAGAKCGTRIEPLTWIAEYKFGATRRDPMVYTGCHMWSTNDKKWVYKEADTAKA